VQPLDWNQMWSIFKAVVATETTYVFRRDTAYWIRPGIASWVSEEKGSIVGMSKLIPNRRDLGSHEALKPPQLAPARRRHHGDLPSGTKKSAGAPPTLRNRLLRVAR